MGNSISQTVLQDHVKLLSDFSSGHAIDQDDRFWRELFAFPASLSSLPPSQVEHRVSDCCISLVSNNGRTQNFQTLLCKALELLKSTQKHPARAVSATNVIYLVRVLFKHLSDSLNAVQLATFSTDTPYTAADIQPSKGANLVSL
ncbi:hypothetical protein ABBQ38_002596 [Trebouxia sp. C0009 RCD-2024]